MLDFSRRLLARYRFVSITAFPFTLLFFHYPFCVYKCIGIYILVRLKFLVDRNRRTTAAPREI